MSIVAQCPHCETRFTLQEEMSGKSMRCPNLECRQVFTVRAQAATAPPPALPPEPPPPPKPAPKPAAPKKPPKTPKPAAGPQVVDAVVVDAAVVSAPKVKEVVWSEGTDVPPPAPPKRGKKPLKAAAADEPDPDFIVRRKKKRNRAPVVLIGLSVAVVLSLLFVVFYVINVGDRNEKTLAERAKGEYAKGEYATAAKSYEALVKEHSGSSKVDEYKFFADLSQTQVAVRSVTNRDDFAPAVARLSAFIEANKESTYAKPKTGYASDILEAGKKLGEDIAGHAGDRVKEARAKPDALAKADAAVAKGRELLRVLEPFRGPDDPPLDQSQAATMLAAAEQGVKRERDRFAALAKARRQLDPPTDALIQGAEADLRAAGLQDDPDAVELIRKAREGLVAQIKFVVEPVNPQAAPPTAAASLLFVTPVGKAKPREPGAGEAPPAVFLCVARGILYALDEDSGNLLWAVRVGPDVSEPPAVARVALAGGPTDVAVVASNVGGPAVAGYALRTGAPLWYQPLAAAPAGPAVVVGSRAFVPVRDPDGTVYEFDLATGQRVGRIPLGQPLAENGTVLRPGTNLLYVSAESRRLYVIDVGGKDDDGNRTDPRCAQVLVTGHLAGTLRVPPLFVGPDGTEPADRWLVLAQADGPAVTRLRAFPVGPVPPPAAGAAPEAVATPAAALPVPGWVWFPPVCDGERLAVASDTGQLRVFGVNQAGNLDKPLFPLAAPPLAGTPADRPVRGLVIPIEEAVYWALTGGQLQRARLKVDKAAGPVVEITGPTLNVGEPLHRAQVGARKDAACLTVRSPHSAGCRAVAFDLRTGDVRWQRQLGLVPARAGDGPAAPVRQGELFVLADEDGGVVAVPATTGVTAGQTLPAPAAWAVAPAPASATGPTVVAASPDGQVVFAVTPVAASDGAKFLVRRIAGGKLIGTEDEVAAPDALAGRPAVVGGALHLPTADGFVHRFVPGAGVTAPASLVAGPKWRGDRAAPGAVCAITPLSDSTFATSDGGKRLARWEWPAGPGANRKEAGEWVLPEPVVGAGAVVPGEGGGPPRVLFADASGSVRLFAADKAEAPLRRWKAGVGLPAGKPSSALSVQLLEGGRPVVAYAIDGKAVAALDPDREEPLWVVPASADLTVSAVGAPQPAGGGRWLVTDLPGRVLVIDAGGEVAELKAAGLPGAVPVAAGSAIDGTALAPLSDGSAVVVELKK